MKQRLSIIAVSIVLLDFSTYAQTTTDSLPNGWKKRGFISTTFSQVRLDNWAAGGNNSLSLASMVNLFANYKHNKITWDNSLDMAYGLLRQNKSNIKTDDKIDFSSKYGEEAFLSNWYYTTLFNFRSQFAPGYKYPNDTTRISNFLAPAYTLLSVGMDYKKYSNFSFFISPITGRITIVNDQELSNAGAFGVDAAEYNAVGKLIKKGRKTRYEVGGYLKTTFRKDIMENINLQTKLELFSNYIEKLENVDVYLDLILTMKINKYISANFTASMIYDDDAKIPTGVKINGVEQKIGPRTQFKEVFGLGLAYKF